MRRATVDSMIRWVSFGTSAMPRLPPLADHEYAVEFDDGFASFVEPARPDPDESEAGPAAGFADLRHSGLRVQRVPVEDRAGEADVLQAHPEVPEERPVVVHATLGERGSRNVMNVMGARNRPPKGSRRTQGKSRRGGHLGLGGARRIHPEHSTSEESDEKKQLSTAITSCSPTPSPYLVRR